MYHGLIFQQYQMDFGKPHVVEFYSNEANVVAAMIRAYTMDYGNEQQKATRVFYSATMKYDYMDYDCCSSLGLPRSVSKEALLTSLRKQGIKVLTWADVFKEVDARTEGWSADDIKDYCLDVYLEIRNNKGNDRWQAAYKRLERKFKDFEPSPHLKTETMSKGTH